MDCFVPGRPKAWTAVFQNEVSGLKTQPAFQRRGRGGESCSSWKRQGARHKLESEGQMDVLLQAVHIEPSGELKRVRSFAVAPLSLFLPAGICAQTRAEQCALHVRGGPLQPLAALPPESFLETCQSAQRILIQLDQRSDLAQGICVRSEGVCVCVGNLDWF